MTSRLNKRDGRLFKTSYKRRNLSIDKNLPISSVSENEKAKKTLSINLPEISPKHDSHKKQSTHQNNYSLSAIPEKNSQESQTFVSDENEFTEILITPSIRTSSRSKQILCAVKLDLESGENSRKSSVLRDSVIRNKSYIDRNMTPKHVKTSLNTLELTQRIHNEIKKSRVTSIKHFLEKKNDAKRPETKLKNFYLSVKPSDSEINVESDKIDSPDNFMKA